MDEQYLHTLRNNIGLALRRAEAALYNEGDVDLDSVVVCVEAFQDYLNKHLPENPPENLKIMIYDTFHEVQMLSTRIEEEIKLAKSKISEGKITQKINNAYTYGIRK